MYSTGSLKGQTAVVTGATGGIGRAISERLAAEGASLCLIGRRLDRLENLSSQLRSAVQGVRFVRCDFGIRDMLTQSLEEINDLCPEVDILVQCAGTIRHSIVADIETQDLDEQIETNLRAPIWMVKALLPKLLRSKGQIVFVNSSVVARAAAKLGIYAATKHGLRGFADSLREEVNADGVRVLSVFPGRTATKMQQTVHAFEGKDYQPDELMQPADVALVVLHSLKMPRSAEITEVWVRPMKKS